MSTGRTSGVEQLLLKVKTLKRKSPRNDEEFSERVKKLRPENECRSISTAYGKESGIGLRGVTTDGTTSGLVDESLRHTKQTVEKETCPISTPTYRGKARESAPDIKGSPASSLRARSPIKAEYTKETIVPASLRSPPKNSSSRKTHSNTPGPLSKDRSGRACKYFDLFDSVSCNSLQNYEEFCASGQKGLEWYDSASLSPQFWLLAAQSKNVSMFRFLISTRVQLEREHRGHPTLPQGPPWAGFQLWENILKDNRKEQFEAIRLIEKEEWKKDLANRKSILVQAFQCETGLRKLAITYCLDALKMDPYNLTETGESALHLAVQTGDVGLVRTVLKYCKANCKNRRQQSVMFFVAKSWMTTPSPGIKAEEISEMCAALMESGCEINDADEMGTTPYMIALNGKYAFGVQLLEALGAHTSMDETAGLADVAQTADVLEMPLTSRDKRYSFKMNASSPIVVAFSASPKDIACLSSLRRRDCSCSWYFGSAVFNIPMAKYQNFLLAVLVELISTDEPFVRAVHNAQLSGSENSGEWLEAAPFCRVAPWLARIMVKAVCRRKVVTYPVSMSMTVLEQSQQSSIVSFWNQPDVAFLYGQANDANAIVAVRLNRPADIRSVQEYVVSVYGGVLPASKTFRALLNGNVIPTAVHSSYQANIKLKDRRLLHCLLQMVKEARRRGVTSCAHPVGVYSVGRPQLALNLARFCGWPVSEDPLHPSRPGRTHDLDILVFWEVRTTFDPCLDLKLIAEWVADNNPPQTCKTRLLVCVSQRYWNEQELDLTRVEGKHNVITVLHMVGAVFSSMLRYVCIVCDVEKRSIFANNINT